MDVAKVAYPKFLEKISICRDSFFGYDYSKFMTGTDLERAKAITGAVNFIISPTKEDDKKEYLKESLLLHQALSLCSSMVEESLRLEAAFFESVRVLIMRLENKGTGKKISLGEMNTRINELLKQSIKSEGVINLFSDIGKEVSLFDPKFLQEVANMKEKNLAVELLKKLIAEQIVIYKRTNVVKSEKFSEIMQRTMNQYLNGMLTNEEVIEEMMKLAKQIKEAGEEGKELGLTADELAFYDALTKRFPGERLAERYAAAYGNRYSCASPRARKLWETFTEECRREGLLWDMKDIIHDYKKKYACTQLEFQF